MDHLVTVAISGSYRKEIERVRAAKTEFEAHGAIVLSPPSTRILAEREGFISLAGDFGPRVDRASFSNLAQVIGPTEDSFLAAVAVATIHYIATGHVGNAVLFETAWRRAHGGTTHMNPRAWLASDEPLIKAYVIPATIPEVLKQEHCAPGMDARISHYLTERAKLAERPFANPYNASVAAGPVLVHDEKFGLVRTCKWLDVQGNPQWSLIGDRLYAGENIDTALDRITREQTGFVGTVGRTVYSGATIGNNYHRPGERRLYVDKIVVIPTLGKAVLDTRAEEFAWFDAKDVLENDYVEPNAKAAVKAAAEYVRAA
ncbi:MAG TPA: NUDIX domain-containing protein [Candidatus Nanoarchaeia archaeon]|nr:NUDIX domain-containing protein [Candidatus Nanoarchaeia archaeon]